MVVCSCCFWCCWSLLCVYIPLCVLLEIMPTRRTVVNKFYLILFTSLCCAIECIRAPQFGERCKELRATYFGVVLRGWGEWWREDSRFSWISRVDDRGCVWWLWMRRLWEVVETVFKKVFLILNSSEWYNVSALCRITYSFIYCL